MKYLLIASFLVFTLCIEEFQKEDNVTVLTDDNFESFMSTHNNVFVAFYAPWCGHCKRMLPEWSKAAGILEKENIYLVKVDATTQEKLAKKYQIDAFPRLKFFTSGLIIDYKGRRTENELIAWTRKKSQPAAIELTTLEELQKFKEENEICIIYFGDNETSLIQYERSAKTIENKKFAYCKLKEAQEKYNAQDNSVVIFKPFEDGRNDLKVNLNMYDISMFVSIYTEPLIIPYDEKASKMLYERRYPCLILFRDDEDPKTKELDQILMRASPKLFMKVKVMNANLTSIKGKRLASKTGISAEDLPTVRLFDNIKEFHKYKLDKEITVENILEFVEDYHNEKLKDYLKSEPIPKEQNGDVFKLVGLNFNKEVIESDKDVLVKFYAPWCINSKKMAPAYIELAKRFKKNNKILIAEVDSTENEIEGFKIDQYPTIKFWPAGKKDSVVNYNGDRTLEDLTNFIKEHATNPVDIENNKQDL